MSDLDWQEYIDTYFAVGFMYRYIIHRWIDVEVVVVVAVDVVVVPTHLLCPCRHLMVVVRRVVNH